VDIVFLGSTQFFPVLAEIIIIIIIVCHFITIRLVLITSFTEANIADAKLSMTALLCCQICSPKRI
jgi:hypothetical protein